MKRVTTIFSPAIGGMAVGFTGLGNLLAAYSEIAAWILCVAGLCLAVPAAILSAVNWRQTLKPLRSANALAANNALSMAFTAASVRLYTANHALGHAMWTFGFFIAIVVAAAFLVRVHGKEAQAEQAIPVRAVGLFALILCGVTAPFLGVTAASYPFAVAGLFFLVPTYVFLYRRRAFQATWTAGDPTFCITCAPFFMTVNCLINSEITAFGIIAQGLWVIGMCAYVLVLARLPRVVRATPTTRFGSMTFPFVISAMGTLDVAPLMGSFSTAVQVIGYAQVAIAVTCVTIAAVQVTRWALRPEA